MKQCMYFAMDIKWLLMVHVNRLALPLPIKTSMSDGSASQLAICHGWTGCWTRQQDDPHLKVGGFNPAHCSAGTSKHKQTQATVTNNATMASNLCTRCTVIRTNCHPGPDALSVLGCRFQHSHEDGIWPGTADLCHHQVKREHIVL
jgi:hypothetical protein